MEKIAPVTGATNTIGKAMAEAVMFLVSQRASYRIGASFPVDGGLNLGI